MALYNKFDGFARDVIEGKHDFSGSTYKILLTDIAPVATDSIKADLTEIAAGNGYAAGGNAVTVTVSDVAGLARASGSTTVFIAAGGPVGPFRYAVLYNATSVQGHLVAWWDYGSSIVLADTDQFAVSFDVTNGIFEVS